MVFGLVMVVFLVFVIFVNCFMLSCVYIGIIVMINFVGFSWIIRVLNICCGGKESFLVVLVL